MDLIPETQGRSSNPQPDPVFIFAQYLKDAISVVIKYDRSGKSNQGDQPARKKEQLQDSAPGTKDREIYYSFANYITPPTIFRLNPESGTSEVFRKTFIVHSMENMYITEQVFYKSKDSTRVSNDHNLQKKAQR